MATTTVHLGKKAGLYLGEADETDPSAMDIVGNVRDVAFTTNSTSVDTSDRDNDGWNTEAVTGLGGQASFQMTWKDDDAALDAIQAAWLGLSEISLAVLSTKLGVGSPKGPVANFMIDTFTINQPNGGVITVDVNCKLSKWHRWYPDPVVTE